MHGFIGGQPHNELTLYAPALGVAYKAIHSAQPPNEIDETLRQVACWNFNRHVDLETEVSDVIIIADSRESALALKPRLDAAGIKHVIYPDDNGQFWDSFPEGE